MFYKLPLGNSRRYYLHGNSVNFLISCIITFEAVFVSLNKQFSHISVLCFAKNLCSIYIQVNDSVESRKRK